MSIERKGIELIKKFLYLYYEKRDRELLAEMLDKDIMWSEEGENFPFVGVDETLDMVDEYWEADSHRYCVTGSIFQTRSLSEDLCLVWDRGWIREKPVGGVFRSQEFLVTAVCRITPQSETLCYMSISIPDFEIEAKNQELQMLTDNVPGAIFCCNYNSALEIIQMSDSFLKLFGYGREEIETVFHNSFLEMIDPRDRESTLEEVKRQMACGDTKELEYRIKKKNGETAWVLDKGRLIKAGSEAEIFYCILVDVTNGKLAQEELALSLEKHRIIMDQTNDIIFEWDIIRDKLEFSGNWEKKFHYKPVTDGFYGGIKKNTHIYPSDLGDFIKAFTEIKNGASYMEMEVRVKKTEDDYMWCRFRLTAQYGKAGRPIKAVGVIIDIDNEKRNSQILLEKAERDPLTKLYNKETSRSLIEDYINRNPAGNKCVFMIIDIDDFKLVNDTLGHLFGDAFLAEVTCEVKKLFRGSDVVGRIGGDEFIAFMKDIVDENLAVYKAMQIVDTFRRLPLQYKLDKTISCSIGIVMFPDYGKSFNELYKKADHALYYAKKQGKNRYVLYDNEVGDELIGIPFTAFASVKGKMDADGGAGTVLNGKLVEYVFKILYKSIDVEAAVVELMEIVGRKFNVSRVYIFENTEDNKYCCNTFEWCNLGVRPEKKNLGRISYEEDLGGIYEENFNEDGIFYCGDVLKLPSRQKAFLKRQGIKSILQCAITDNGVFRGYVGFDECRMNRLWTQEQINTLIFVSEILSTFLLKRRAQDKAIQSLEAMEEILDNQNAWIYVIDLENYQMCYINRKTRALVPEAEEGMYCYKVFFNREEPCELCPARAVAGGSKNCTYEIYNPVMKIWSSAEASLISWKGKRAGLITCHDISKYK